VKIFPVTATSPTNRNPCRVFASQQDFVSYRKTQFTIDRIGAAALAPLLSASEQSSTGLSQQFDNQVTGV
jgi:hypothetical protein